MTYGLQNYGGTGLPIDVLVDFEHADWKVGGITLDWATVTAAGSDTALPGGWTQKTGTKAIRHGQILCKITLPEVQTIDLSGDADPSGGTFTITVPGYGTTAAIAYNASAGTIQTALELIVGAGKVTVQKSTFVLTLTFDKSLGLNGNVGQVTVGAGSLTSGGSITVTIATTHSGTSYGKYGPYDPSATDGRQTLTRGECWILNQTVFEVNPLTGPFSTTKDHPAVFDGGTVWKARVLATSGAHSLAAGPTWTEFEAAFPRIQYV